MQIGIRQRDGCCSGGSVSAASQEDGAQSWWEMSMLTGAPRAMRTWYPLEEWDFVGGKPIAESKPVFLAGIKKRYFETGTSRPADGGDRGGWVGWRVGAEFSILDSLGPSDIRRNNTGGESEPEAGENKKRRRSCVSEQKRLRDGQRDYRIASLVVGVS
jgi:hypothetical protein